MALPSIFDPLEGASSASQRPASAFSSRSPAINSCAAIEAAITAGSLPWAVPCKSTRNPYPYKEE